MSERVGDTATATKPPSGGNALANNIAASLQLLSGTPQPETVKPAATPEIAAIGVARAAAEQKLVAAEAALAQEKTPADSPVKKHVIAELAKIRTAFTAANDLTALGAVEKSLTDFAGMAGLLERRAALHATRVGPGLADPVGATPEQLATLPPNVSFAAIDRDLDAVPPSTAALDAAETAIAARGPALVTLNQTIADRKRLDDAHQKLLDDVKAAADPPGATPKQSQDIEALRQKVRDLLPEKSAQKDIDDATLALQSLKDGIAEAGKLVAARTATEQKLVAAEAALAQEATPAGNAVKQHVAGELTKIRAAFTAAADAPALGLVDASLVKFADLSGLLARRATIEKQLEAPTLADPAGATPEQLATLPANVTLTEIRKQLDTVPPTKSTLDAAETAVAARGPALDTLRQAMAERKRLDTARQKVIDDLAAATDPAGATPKQTHDIEALRQKVRDALPATGATQPDIDKATAALANVTKAIADATLAIPKRTQGAGFKTGGSAFSTLTGTDALTTSQKAAIDAAIQKELDKSDADVSTINFQTIAQNAVNHVQTVAKVTPTYKDGSTPSQALVTKFNDLNALASKSPTMKDALFELQGRPTNQFPIKIDKTTNGASCQRAGADRGITVSENYANSLSAPLLVQTIAHESGHAKYTPGNASAATTKAQWVNLTVRNNLIDEAEATMFNCKVRKEIIANGGADIGVAGANSAAYISIYEEYVAGTKTRQQALDAIATSFGTGETTSTNGQNYDTYYRTWATANAPASLPP